jgi:hypothetical protein
MPAKFVVQRRVERGNLTRKFRKYLDRGEPKSSDSVWVDTVWTSLADAQENYPNEEYREVMTKW